MNNKLIIIVTYILIFFNFNLSTAENNNELRIGLLAPLSGQYKDLGDSLLYSLQLALDEIDDEDVYIIPRDSGSNNRELLIKAIDEMRKEGVNIVIGPIDSEDFKEVSKFNDMVFISPSNMSPYFQNNIISIGITLESQMVSLMKLIVSLN